MNLHNTAALLKQSFWTAPYRRVSWHNYRHTSQTNFESGFILPKMDYFIKSKMDV